VSVSAIQTSFVPNAPVSGSRAAALRRSTGEFVGDIFYGTLLREMQQSKFKTKYLSGGRAEEAFQGQLSMEIAKKIGRSGNDPVARRLFDSIAKRLGVEGDA
jgi:hypothetical protein